MSRIGACLFLLCAVCATSAITFYESALEHYAAGNFAAAEIELRNALKNAPYNVPARVLLGKVLLQTGDPREAATELEKGLSLGGDQNLILVPLAEVYLQLLQPEKVLTNIVLPGTDPTIDTSLLVLRGNAALLLGDSSTAQAHYREALERRPGDVRAIVGQARVALARGRDGPARELIDSALEANPSSIDALTLRGLVARDAGDPEAAQMAFDAALELDPRDIKALGARAALAIDRGNTQQAVADLEVLRLENPADLEGAYLRSWLMVSEGRIEQARDELAFLVGVLNDIDEENLERLPQAHLLNGVFSFLNTDYEQAVEFFTHFLARFPDHSGARRYLAASHLALGDWSNVIRSVMPHPGMALPEQPAMLALLAEAYRAEGDFEQATRYFEKALEADPDRVMFALGLASSRFAGGDIQTAITAMETLVERVPEFREAQLHLIGMYVDAGYIAEAVAKSRELASQRADDALSLNLLGVVMMTSGRVKEAADYFERARLADPTATLPLLNAARLKRQGDAIAESVALYQEVLERDPDAIDARLELAEVYLEQERIEAAATMIESLLERVPNHPRTRLAELWLLLARGETEALGEAIYALSSAHPNSAAVNIGIARVYVGLGDRENAKLLLHRAAEYAGFDSNRLHEIAELQIGLEALDAAQWTLTKAQSGNPRHLGVLAARAALQLKRRDYAAAAAVVEELRTRYPERRESFLYAGALAQAQGDWRAAVEAFTRAHEIAPNKASLRKLFEAQVDAGELQEAFNTIRVWILLHPEDLDSRHRLAEKLIGVGAYKSAKMVYEGLLKRESDNPLLSNNLAYVLQRLGDPRAREFAQQAVELAPDNPDFLDTYGWILAENGEPERGLAILRDAQSRQSTNDEIRYHIALALVALQRDAAAQRELQTALASARAFPSREAAQNLLVELQARDQ